MAKGETTRVLARAAAPTLAVLVVSLGAGPAAANEFRVELFGEGQAQGEYAECFVRGSTLDCLLYTRDPPAGARCDAGGAVALLRMAPDGRVTRGHVCVDEGSHDQPFLRSDDPPFRSRGGVFRCRVSLVGSGRGVFEELRCRTASAAGFTLGANGRVRILGDPAGGAGGVTLTVAQLRINQRISQAALRRIEAVDAHLDGREPPTFLLSDDPAGFTLSASQLAINQRISQAAVRRVNALTARVGGRTPAPERDADADADAATDRITLSASQLAINQRIAQAAVRRVNALVARTGAPAPVVVRPVA